METPIVENKPNYVPIFKQKTVDVQRDQIQNELTELINTLDLDSDDFLKKREELAKKHKIENMFDVFHSYFIEMIKESRLQQAAAKSMMEEEG